MICFFPSLSYTPLILHLQSNVDSIHSWATQNFLTFNTSKCKYMLLSRKRSSLLSYVSFNLQLGSNKLERVSCYRYLGVTISDDLYNMGQAHQPNVQQNKATYGLFYRRFSKHLSPAVLVKLYKVLIRPHLEYCPYVWDPSTIMIKLKQQIESVQKFALRVCLKQWNITAIL